MKRNDFDNLIKKQLQAPNIMYITTALNNEQWIVVQSVYSHTLALNLKTHQTIAFHNYPHSIYRLFISFDPEPILIISSSYGMSIELITQSGNKKINFVQVFFSFFDFDESLNALMFVNLLSNEQKRVRLIKLVDLLQNPSKEIFLKTMTSE